MGLVIDFGEVSSGGLHLGIQPLCSHLAACPSATHPTACCGLLRLAEIANEPIADEAHYCYDQFSRRM